jgi:putative spermidine/putrescine transport system ATP-binding protein
VLDGAVAESLLGDRGVYAVRPEKITVLPPDAAAPPGAHRASGTVAEVVYAGSTTRVLVDIGTTTLAAVLLNTTAGEVPELSRGARVVVAWQPSAAHPLES